MHGNHIPMGMECRNVCVLVKMNLEFVIAHSVGKVNINYCGTKNSGRVAIYMVHSWNTGGEKSNMQIGWPELIIAL